jgi:hypothetical protein
LYGRFVLHDTIPGWTSVVLLMTFFTGVILMSIAVVGAYVGRIFEQGQHHPLYWLERACNVPPSRAVRGQPRASMDVDASREVRLSRTILAVRSGADDAEAAPGPAPVVEVKARVRSAATDGEESLR